MSAEKTAQPWRQRKAKDTDVPPTGTAGSGTALP